MIGISILRPIKMYKHEHKTTNFFNFVLGTTIACKLSRDEDSVIADASVSIKIYPIKIKLKKNTTC